MDKQGITQLITIVAVLSLLVPWLPSDDVMDPLGRGSPQMALKIDSMVKGLEGVPDGGRAFMRSIRGVDENYFKRWKSLLRRVRTIREEADENTVVQFKNMFRNEQWRLIYDLYPIRCVGKTYEEGSRPEDPTVPGAHVIVGTFSEVEMNIKRAEIRQQRREWEQR